MSVRVRRLYSGSVVTTSTNVASLLVSKSANIVAVVFNVMGIGAAAIDSWGAIELSRSNAYQISTSDVQNTVAMVTWASTVASTSIKENLAVVCGSVPVAAGDYLYLHCFRSGTQPTSLTVHCTIYCQE